MINNLHPFEYFQNTMLNHSTKLERRDFQIARIPSRKWDVLTEAKNYIMCLLAIQSSDGKMDHAICVVSDWIFDSNFEKALPLTKESLDLCRSSEDRKAVFVSVRRGLVLKYQR